MKKIFALILTVAMALLAFSACKDKEEDNKSYTVTFDSDGGSEVASQTVESGEKATKPADPVKDRYTFLGWFVGGEKYDFEKPVTSDLTLTAKWSVSAYTVTVNADNGAEVKTETVEHGVFVELPENPTKTGFEFLGWFVGGEEYDFSTPVTSDITIIAKWKQITYKVIIDSNNGEEPVSETVAHGSCLELPEDPAYTGFELLGWFVGDERYDFEKPVTSGFTIVAKWQAATVDLSAIAGTWSGVENGINTYELVIDADGSVTAKYENSYTKVELQKNYVLFDGERFTFNYTSDLVSGEMVFVFSKDNYTLTTNSAVAGQQLILTRKFAVTFDYNYEKSGAPKTVYVEYGKTVTEEKATRVGYNRDGWYLGETKFNFTTPITSDITLAAKWSVKKYSVVFYKQNGVKLKELEVEYNHVLTADEIPSSGMITKDGCKFNGRWYSSLSATSPQNLDKGITEAKKYYPGIIDPMTDIAGSWSGIDKNGVSYEIVVDAVTQSVSAALVKGGVSEELNVTTVMFKEFSGTTKLIIRYKTEGSATETPITLTYTNGTFTASNSLILFKEGAVKYTVTFDSDGGTEVAPQNVGEGGKANEPTEPTKDGLSFAGWYLEGVKYDFASTVTKDITLVAKWVTSRNVTFDYGYAGKYPESITVADGFAVQSIGNPTRSNYTFLGWYLEDEEYDFASLVTKDITLVAKWQGVSKTVKIYKQDGTLYKEIVDAEYGKTVDEVLREKLTAEEYMNLSSNLCTVDGSYFTGMWFTSAIGTTEVKFSDTITGNKNIYAAFVSPLIKDFEGVWNCVIDGKFYEITVTVETDSLGNITDVEAIVNDGTSYAALWIRTYVKEGSKPEIHIASDADLEKLLITYIVDEATGDYSWFCSEQPLTKQ
ncbi:MAG: hypothetical protein E7673_05685 [Ruminococcaceae bacterium]|nr:hypothetical protein [Oscillospiraceae bacterium]